MRAALLAARRLLVGALVLASVAGGVSADVTAAGDQQIAISGMTFVAGSGSVNELVLWAEKARVDASRQVVTLEQLHVSLAGDSTRPSIELRCRSGELNLLTNDFRLEGEVRGRTTDGRSFQTDWLGYEEARKILYTDAEVMLRESGGAYRGGGLRLELTARRLLLLDGVRVVREQ